MAKKAEAPKPGGSPTTITTSKIRLSFVHIFEPTAMEGSDVKKYNVQGLVPKTDTELVAKINAAVAAAEAGGLTTKFGGKIPVANFKRPLRDGDAERPDDPTYKGMYFFTASTRTKPGIVDQNREDIIDSTKVYSGCYGRLNINFYPFNTNGNKGIACGLNHVQFLEDGEALGGRGSASDAFDDDAEDLTA